MALTATLERLAPPSIKERVRDAALRAWYTTTNECLESLAIALKPSEGDTIIMPCGSGDQAFIMGMLGAKVIAIDHNPGQVRYAKERQEAAHYGDKEAFINPICAFFTGADDAHSWRMRVMRSLSGEQLRRAAANVTIQEGNLLPALWTERYNKVHLSNVIEHVLWYDKRPDKLTRLRNQLQALENMPPGGIIVQTDSSIRARLLGRAYGAWFSDKGLPFEEDKSLEKSLRGYNIMPELPIRVYRRR